jgi:hypothetical protein
LHDGDGQQLDQLDGDGQQLDQLDGDGSRVAGLTEQGYSGGHRSPCVVSEPE